MTAAADLRHRFDLACWLFGGWIGLVIGLKLVALVGAFRAGLIMSRTAARVSPAPGASPPAPTNASASAGCRRRKNPRRYEHGSSSSRAFAHRVDRGRVSVCWFARSWFMSISRRPPTIRGNLRNCSRSRTSWPPSRKTSRCKTRFANSTRNSARSSAAGSPWIKAAPGCCWAGRWPWCWRPGKRRLSRRNSRCRSPKPMPANRP